MATPADEQDSAEQATEEQVQILTMKIPALEDIFVMYDVVQAHLEDGYRIRHIFKDVFHLLKTGRHLPLGSNSARFEGDLLYVRHMGRKFKIGPKQPQAVLDVDGNELWSPLGVAKEIMELHQLVISDERFIRKLEEAVGDLQPFLARMQSKLVKPLKSRLSNPFKKTNWIQITRDLYDISTDTCIICASVNAVYMHVVHQINCTKPAVTTIAERKAAQVQNMGFREGFQGLYHLIDWLPETDLTPGIDVEATEEERRRSLFLSLPRRTATPVGAACIIYI